MLGLFQNRNLIKGNGKSPKEALFFSFILNHARLVRGICGTYPWHQSLWLMIPPFASPIKNGYTQCPTNNSD